MSKRARGNDKSRNPSRGGSFSRGKTESNRRTPGNWRKDNQVNITTVKRLDQLPSISRSGGDNGEGDTYAKKRSCSFALTLTNGSLKDRDVQNEYWQSIEEKVGHSYALAQSSG